MRTSARKLGAVAALVWSTVVAVGGAGCAGRSTVSPAATLRRYADAIATDDARAAYQLLSPSLRSSVRVEDFEKQWHDNRRERDEQRQLILTMLSRRHPSLSERAELRLVQGSVIHLSSVSQTFGNSWVLSDANLRSVSATTPQEALRLLLLAAEQRNFSALLRILSSEQRQALEAQLSERIERLRAALLRPSIEVSGDRARIEYDPRFFIELTREGGSWRVTDLN